MVYKPRSQKLSPQKVRANLLDQQERLAHSMSLEGTVEATLKKISKLPLPAGVRTEARDKVDARLAQITTEVHAQLQAVAEINPAYRPLIGSEGKETALLIQEHTASLSAEERREFSLQLKKVIHLSSFDPLEFMALAFLAGSGEQEPPSLDPSSGRL